MKKYIKPIFLLLIFFNFLFANTLEKVSLRLQWKHQFEFAGFYVAKEKGYYKEAGIDVELFEYDANVDIVQEIVDGKKDFAIWGSGVIEQAMNGKPIVLLANYFKRSPLAIITQGDIILPSELEGKRLMIPKSDYDSANYQQMFSLFNVDKNKIELVPSSFNLQDFIDKKVDAYSSFLTNEPFVLRKKGIRYNVLDPNNYGIEMYDVNLFSSKEFVQKNPNLIKNFIDATNKGWEYALKNKEEAVDLILNKYNTQNKSKEHLLFEAKETQRMMLNNIYPIGSVDIEKVKKMGSFFTERGMTKSFYNYDSIIFQPIKRDINLTKQEQNFVEISGVIPISVMKDFSPFSMEINGKYRGFVDDLLSLLEHKTGLKFQRVTGQWVENLNRFKSGETKIIADISYKKEREDFTLFTKPYYEIPTLIFVRDDFKDYKGLESFNGRKVGVQKDIFYANEVSKIKGVELVANESIEQMAKDLSLGKIDIAIMNLLTMNHYIKRNALSNISAIDELNLETVNKEDLRLGVNPNEPLLFSIIQKGMEKISFEELNQITNKWIGLNAKNIEENLEKSSNNSMFTESEKEYLDSKEELKICVDPNWMPIEAIDSAGKHIGISSDFKNMVSQKLNKKITVVPTTSWEESLKTIKDGKCDILSFAKKTKSRSEYLDFTKSFYHMTYVISTKKDKFFIDNFDEVKDKKFAVVKGYAVEEDLETFYPNTPLIKVNSIDEGLDLVQSEKVYGYIDATATLGYAIDKFERYDLKIIGKMSIGYDLSYAVSKGNEELLSILEKTIESISEDDKKRIYKKWVALIQETVTDYSLVWKIVLISLLSLILIGYWNSKIIKAKKELEQTNELLKLAQMEIKNKNVILEKLASTDKLTKVFNRTKLDEILTLEMHRSKRFNYSFGFCILDIDYFKAINDNFGHLVGDKILADFARLLKDSTRKTDYLGRWGGEEFVIIVPESNKESLTLFIDKLRKKIESTNFDEVGNKTASFGITLSKDNDEIKSIIKRADDALYEAKRSGRNKVCSNW